MPPVFMRFVALALSVSVVGFAPAAIADDDVASTPEARQQIMHVAGQPARLTAADGEKVAATAPDADVNWSKALDALGVPACQSKDAEKALKNTYENGPASKVLNLELYELEDADEYSFDDQARKCIGVAMTNQGMTYFNYEFKPSRNRPGEYYITLEQLEPHEHRMMYEVIFRKTEVGRQQERCKNGELNIDGGGRLSAKCEKLYPYPEKRSRWYKR